MCVCRLVAVVVAEVGSVARMKKSAKGDRPKSDEGNDRSKQNKQQQPWQRQRSPNKIYRTPPTPEPEILHVKERSFVLDSIAVNTTSNDYAKARPKLGQVHWV